MPAPTWVRKRRSELLDCPYFHLVFTLPQPIAALALQNPRVLYSLLFRAASRTLRTLASDPKHLGAEIGFFAVLHSWGQALQLHPHLHCVVPGGGIAPDGDRWIACRPGFFLPVRVLSRLFRRLFLERLQQAFRSGRLQFRHTLAPLNDPDAFARYLQPLRQAEWVVYAKSPFAGPHQVLDYLGRYTHRVAISNHRLLAVEDGQVRFRWRDYRHHRRLKTLTLSAEEFIRRFLLHVLPKDFHRIRYFGFLACRHRQQKLALCRRLLDMPPPSPPSLLPTIMTCSSSLPELLCSSARPVAEGACSSWVCSSRESPRRRRIPHDHRSLGSTSPTAKTLLSLIRDTCVLPHAAGSHPSTAPTPATLRISTYTSPLPVSTPQSGPHVPDEPPSRS